MSLTSRKRRPLDRTIPHLRDTRLVVIAAEGQRTEKQYFEIFRRKSSRVQVLVLETPDGKSAPKHVLNRLRAYRKTQNLLPGDKLWLVIDKDRWLDSQLKDVARKARSNHFELAVSTPCFEAWLYLHHADPSSEMAEISCRDLDNRLRALWGGYDSSNLQINQFDPYVDEAIRRAISLDINPDYRWQTQFGSRVYRMVEAIKALI